MLDPIARVVFFSLLGVAILALRRRGQEYATMTPADPDEAIPAVGVLHLNE